MHPALIALVGTVSLAALMGVGRFAFTPILPMMLNDGLITLPGASALASLNYVGYLVGAMLGALQPWAWRHWPQLPTPSFGRLVQICLVVTVLVTWAMASPWPLLWAVARVVAGVASAIGFIYTSGWCLARLTAAGAPAIGGLIYAGPGFGIALTGFAGSALVAAHVHSATAWLAFGGLALLAVLLVWKPYGGAGPRLASQRPGAAARPRPEQKASRTEVALLVTGYGFAGFGYIITATFAPVIARAALPESSWIDLFWPIFGVGSLLGALAATRLSMRRDLRRALVFAHLIQTVGIVLPLLWPGTAGFVIGSFLLGVPFTVITFLVVQQAQRLQPGDPASLIALLTACYGLGQIVGPPMTGWLVAAAATVAAGFDQALAIAAAALVAGALLYGLSMRWWPLRTAPAVSSPAVSSPARSDVTSRAVPPDA